MMKVIKEDFQKMKQISFPFDRNAHDLNAILITSFLTLEKDLSRLTILATLYHSNSILWKEAS